MIGVGEGVALGERQPLSRGFYARDTDEVARALLGTILEHDPGDGRASGRIVETEAYLGPDDPASHAVVGLTTRTRDLFGTPGTSYVYFVYGMHWCFNAVAHERGRGAAVLVRAIEPVEGLVLMRRRRWGGAEHATGRRRDRDLTNGPGKLCAALGIGRSQSGLALQVPPLVVRRGRAVADADVAVSPRIGITRAVEGLHRYFVRDNAFVSPTPRRLPVCEYAGRAVVGTREERS